MLVWTLIWSPLSSAEVISGAASVLTLRISAVCIQTDLLKRASKFGGITRWRILGTTQQKANTVAELFLVFLIPAVARFVIVDSK
jgi:hypothetical protein